MTIPALQELSDGPVRPSVPRYRSEPCAEPPKLPVRRVQLRLDRNLALYPLARDLRRKPKWRRSVPAGRFWLADLPGDNRIGMRLPADAGASMKRAPTAIDVAVLFAVMAEVQAAGGVVIAGKRPARIETVVWDSMTSFTKGLGLDRAMGGRVASLVRSALEYWQIVELIYRNVWRADGQVEEFRYLPPPFTAVSRPGRTLAIELAPEWRAVAAAYGYWTPVALPLPAAPAAQNLVLVMVSQEKPLKEFDARFVTRKTGLDSSRRNSTLETAIATAQAWFAENRGELVVARNESPNDVVRPGKIWMSTKPVHVPKRRSANRGGTQTPGLKNRGGTQTQTGAERKPYK